MMGLGAGMALSGGAQAAGGLISSAGQIWANKQNLKLQREQMRWEEHMSSTAYQRQVADMKAAGINPMLAAMKGGGASTPNVAAAQMENPAAGLGAGISSAASVLAEYPQQATRLDNESRNTDALVKTQTAQQGLIDAQRLKTEMDTLLGRFDLEQMKPQERAQLQQKIKNLVNEYDLISANRRAADASAAASTARKDLDQAELRVLNAVAPLIEQGGKALKELMDYANSGKIGDAIANAIEAIKEQLRYHPFFGTPGKAALDDYIRPMIDKALGAFRKYQGSGQTPGVGLPSTNPFGKFPGEDQP